MEMKKLLAMLLAAVMVLSLAACGGAGGSGGSGGGDAAKVDTTAEGFRLSAVFCASVRVLHQTDIISKWCKKRACFYTKIK